MPGQRSLLSVPASSPRMLEKAAALDADVVMIDLEDSVAPEAKVSARANAIGALRDLTWGKSRRAFRVNGLETPYFYRDLIEVVEACGDYLSLVVVPKIDRPEDVVTVDTLLRQIEAHVSLPPGQIRIQAQIESPAGLVSVEAIARAAERLESLNFGPGDYAAGTGMPSAGIGAQDEWDERYPGHRLHYPMSRLLVAARAAGLAAIDGPFADFRDLEGFRDSCMRARALGYEGKWCIHPAQIPVANEAFAPTAEERAWAERLIAVYRDATARGDGSASIDGRMIDAASIRMARSVLSRCEQEPSHDR